MKLYIASIPKQDESPTVFTYESSIVLGTSKTKGEKGTLLRSLNCNWVTNWCARYASLLCQVHPQVLGNNRLGLRRGGVIYWQIGVGV